jgi:hypothetical protein
MSTLAEIIYVAVESILACIMISVILTILTLIVVVVIEIIKIILGIIRKKDQ